METNKKPYVRLRTDIDLTNDPVTGVTDALQNHLSAAKRSINSEILVQILQREPADEDFADLVHKFDVQTNNTIVYYRGICIGQIIFKMEVGSKLEMVFEPL